MTGRRIVWVGATAAVVLVALAAWQGRNAAERAGVRSVPAPQGVTDPDPSGKRGAGATSSATAPSTNGPAPAAPPPVRPPAADPLEGARILAERESPPRADGSWVRTRLLETAAKYPYIRLEETRRFDKARNEIITVQRGAMVADHILVRLHPQAMERELVALNRQFHATIRRPLKRPGHYIVAFESFGLDTIPQRIADYRASSLVTDVAEPDYLLEMVDTIPDDPRYGDLWGLSTIRCPEAWDRATGNGAIVVGVIDSGVDYAHEDLAANIWTNPEEVAGNGVDDDNNGYVDDVYGWDFGNEDADPLGPSYHGTHVAGTIAAVGNNRTGVVGVAWNTRIMPLKMFGDDGTGLTSDAIDALAYAIMMRERGVPIRLTNHSWGGGYFSVLLKDTIADSGAAGMLLVAAAGNYPQFFWRNNDLTPLYPASYELENIIAVAASTATDELASFSHYGPRSVDLAAPGQGILSSMPGNGYDYLDGTSMATPHVAGACALIWEAYPEATWEQVRDFIMSTVATNSSLVGRIASDGRLDLAAALDRIEPTIEHTPLPNTTNTVDDIVVEATVLPFNLLVPGSVQMHWNTTGPDAPFTMVAMDRVAHNLYRATIPAQPLGRTVYYYLQAETVGGTVRSDPVTAPFTPHQFEVVDAVVLWISGKPSGIEGGVNPGYGMHPLPRGIRVTAAADRYTDVTAEQRYACVGWAAIGSAPTRGETNRVTFNLDADTALSWWWQFQYSLLQSSAPTGVIDTVTWWETGTAGQTVSAMDPVMIGADQHRFVEWRLDGTRWPTAAGVAVNPAGSIEMTRARQATAVYLPADQDGDGDGLPDWWEHRFFGGLSPAAGDDPDGDGYCNDREMADGTDPRDAASVPAPPEVAHVPLADPQTGPAPWRVDANVTDNFNLASVELEWRKVPQAWNQMAMIAGGGDGFSGTIPAPGVPDDRFEYRVVAVDGAGYTNQTQHFTFDVVYPVLACTPTNIAALMRPGMVSNVAVTLANVGNTGLTWNARSGWLDGVERGTGTVTHGGNNDRWHISTNRACTGSHAWYCGDVDQGQYINRIDASLVLPPVLPVEGTFLTFRHWAKIEYDITRNDDHYWDGGMVEISTNGGRSFVQITPVGGYPHRITPNDQSPFPYDTPCYGGDGEGWQEAQFDLAPYAGQIVQLRFRFGSDWAAVEEGWYIDEIAVAFPDPLSGWLGVQPDAGALATGESSVVTVRLDSAGIPTGSLGGMVRVASSDPSNPANRVGVALAVQAASDLVLQAAAGDGLTGMGTNVVFQWNGFSDRSYTLYQRTSLTDSAESWVPVAGASQLSGISGTMTYTVNVAHVSQRFYRLAVE